VQSTRNISALNEKCTIGMLLSRLAVGLRIAPPNYADLS
jgi:hypothetical protein